MKKTFNLLAKTILTLILISISAITYANEVTYLDLEQQAYRSSTEVKILDSAQNTYTIAKDEELIITEIVNLGYIKVTLIKVDLPSCKDNDLNVEMQIIRHLGVDLGMQLEEECKINIFIENVDLKRLSFLKK
jgi:hypothetical protein